MDAMKTRQRHTISVCSRSLFSFLELISVRWTEWNY